MDDPLDSPEEAPRELPAAVARADDGKEDEHYRLGGRPPLRTIFALAIGPVFAQMTIAIYGIVDTIWVSQALSELGMAVVSTYSAFDSIGRAFGFFVNAAGASQIAALFGAHRGEEAAQVLADLFRVCLAFGLLIPAVLAPTIRPIARWIGADDQIVAMGWDYMIPLMVCSFSTCMFLGSGGCLQGEGRSFLFACMNLLSTVLNGIVLDPLLMLAIPLGIRGCALATVISEIIPLSIIVFWYARGKFSVKPKLSHFFSKFSPCTLPALKVGISQLILNLSQLIPSIIIRKLISSSSSPEEYEDSMAGYNVMIRLFIFTNSFIIGTTMGFLPPAAYSFAQKNYRRWMWLAFHAFWITGAWASFTCVLTWTIPRQLSQMFSGGEGYLDWAEALVRTGNALNFCANARFLGVAFLQSMQRGIFATVFSFCAHLVSLLGFAALLFFTDRHNAVRILWAYGIAYVFGFVAAIGTLARPIWSMWRESREMDQGATDEREDCLNPEEPPAEQAL
jgi:Na+-driven multidrug efflux pump